MNLKGCKMLNTCFCDSAKADLPESPSDRSSKESNKGRQKAPQVRFKETEFHPNKDKMFESQTSDETKSCSDKKDGSFRQSPNVALSPLPSRIKVLVRDGFDCLQNGQSEMTVNILQQALSIHSTDLVRL